MISTAKTPAEFRQHILDYLRSKRGVRAMTNRCIHTGALCWSDEYDCAIYGDLHWIAGAIVFRTASRDYFRSRSRCDYRIARIGHWFEDQPYGTMLVHPRHFHFSGSPEQYISRWGEDAMQEFKDARP